MIAHGKPLNDKLKVTITKHQHELILEHVSIYIIDSEIEDLISNAIPKKGKCHIYFTAEELESLIGTMSFVANHEEKNENLTLELDDLIDNMESALNEG